MFSYQSADIEVAPGETLYALIDCSMDTRIRHRMARILQQCNYVNLFRGTFAAEAEQYSPILLELNTAIEARRTMTCQLSNACEGIPLLSFMMAAVPLDILANHLRSILTIHTADGQEFLLRYADNRMLPAIMAVMTDAQRRMCMGPISHWHVATHLDAVTMLTAPPSVASEKPLSKLELDDRQLAQLLETTEIHSIVSQLEQFHSSFKGNHTQAERIQFVERNIAKAADFGFYGMQDRIAWCSCALRGGEAFFENEAINAVLKGAAENKQTLDDALLLMPQEQWQATFNEQQAG